MSVIYEQNSSQNPKTSASTQTMYFQPAVSNLFDS